MSLLLVVLLVVVRSGPRWKFDLAQRTTDQMVVLRQLHSFASLGHFSLELLVRKLGPVKVVPAG